MYAKRNYIVFKDERYTFEQVWKDSLKIATWLQASFQVRKGDRGKRALCPKITLTIFNSRHCRAELSRICQDLLGYSLARSCSLPLELI